MKKNILYMHPGPARDPQSSIYRNRFEELSKIFRGYIFTTAHRGETIQMHDFIYFSMARRKNGILRILGFIIFCVRNAVKLSNERVKVDLVSTYDPLFSGIIGVLISRITRSKLIVEINGVYTSDAEWVDNAGALGTKLKKYLYPLIMRFILKRADGIKLLFSGQIDPFNKYLDGKIIRNFPNFVPVDHFKNIREDKEVLFVGFPFKRKGVDILIAAFKKIAPKYPDWKLKILGWFPDPKELTDAIGGHPQIYHHPPVKYYEMPLHIGSCAIFVLPSRSEGMGRVLVEAMAAGKPRIGSNIDGIPTVIKDGVDGLLFESENVDDLAEKLDRLMNSPQLRHNLGKTGELRARQDCSKEAYFNNLNNFYDEVLHNDRNE